jgi:hypothetical protein
VLAASLIPVFPWIARNYIVFGLPKLTTVDTTNMVYFVGAGSYQLKYDLTLDAAQERIQSEFKLPAYSAVQNHWKSDKSPAEMERLLSKAVPQVLMRFPWELAKSSVLAIGKASVSHSTEHWGYLLGIRWNPPGTLGIVQLDSAAWRRLTSNHPILVGSLAWQMSHTGLALLLAAVGFVMLMRHRLNQPSVWLFAMTTAYLYLTVALFGLEAFYRCRIPVAPFLYVAAGGGFAYFVARIRQLNGCSRQ